MSTQLHIGEVAKLLGITPKTIRHYHKVGLLAEPQRTESGYRLYSAGDLLRLQRIRRLQALGLSLKQIKTLLGEHVSGQERSLRDVLQSLLTELTAEIQSLEEQRERIATLLKEESIEILASSSNTSPTLEYVKEHFGEHLSGVSEEVLKLDAKVFSQLDAFNWPESYHPGARLYILHVAEHPLLYQQMLGLAERLAALVSLQEDAPEVDQLIEDVLASDELLTIFSMQSEFSEHISGRLASPIADVLSELTSDTLSPAQLRFLEAMSCILSDSSKEIGFPKESESEVGSPKVGIAEAGSEEVGSPEMGISEGGLEEVGSGEAGKSDQSQRKCSHGLYNQHRSSRAISPFSMRDTGKRVERDGVGSL